MRLLEIADGVVSRRRAHQAGQEPTFNHGQRADILAEVHLGGGLQAVRVVTEVDRIEIPLEDLVLVQLLLQHGGVVRLQHLVAAVAWQAGQELVLHHLLGNRAGTLRRRVAGKVGEQRAEEPAQIDPAVRVELVVLYRQQ